MTFDNMNKNKNEKPQSAEEDEGKSFGDIIVTFDQFKLDLKYLLQWPITTKPYAIWTTGKNNQTRTLYSGTLCKNSVQSNLPKVYHLRSNVPLLME